MKKENFNKNAANAAQTVKKENGTEQQNPTTTATVETTESGTPTPTAETVKPTESETVTPKAETIEELQKRLEIELNRLNRKKELAKHREKFINSMGSLQLYIDELQNENEFETQSAKITFTILETEQYNQNHAHFESVFSISNTALIKEFCNMLYSKMGQKRTEIETELLAA